MRNSGQCSVVSGRKWLIGEAVVNDAVTMVFILSRIARIVDQKIYSIAKDISRSKVKLF